MWKLRWLLPLGLLGLVGAFALAGSEIGTTPQLKQKDLVIPPWKGMQVSMDILVNGKSVPLVYWKGKIYLPVKNWDIPYQIRVWNHGSKRTTAIVSVDGLSVISCEPASEASAGYLVSPRSSIVIKGWRQDNEMVAAFKFVERSQSYASKIGHPENVGVIGLIAFEEQTAWPKPFMDYKQQATAPAEAGGSKSAVGGTGTGYGHNIYQPTYEVPFVRSTNKRMVVIYYDTVENLRDAGVPIEMYYPDPFPGERKLPPWPMVKE